MSSIPSSPQVLGDSQVRGRESKEVDRRSTGERTAMAQSSRQDRHERQDKSPDTLKLPTWLIVLLVGILITFAGTLASMAQWKGQIESQVSNLQDRAKEDRDNLKIQLDYIRTQGEVNGKELARIRAWQDQQEKKGNR